MRLFKNTCFSNELIDKLLKTDDIEEVKKVTAGVKYRSVFIEIINDLLNKLSEETQSRIDLEIKIKRMSKRKEEK